MTATITELESLLQPALDRYADACREHSREWSPELGSHCRCGFTPPAHMTRRGSRSRSVGLHVSAAHKRAGKAYDAEAATIVASRKGRNR